MLIHVTSQHIDYGEVESPEDCPIALAINEELGGGQANVGHIIVNAGTPVLRQYWLPRSAQRFIKAFDEGRPVGPFNFRLEEKVR